jgi:hypothetical protein
MLAHWLAYVRALGICPQASVFRALTDARENAMAEAKD